MSLAFSYFSSFLLTNKVMSMIAELPKKIFSIALYQPEIPANTGNIIRLAACLHCKLHLIHPLGFDFSDRHLKRAGLDYHDLIQIIHHACEKDFWDTILLQKGRVIGLSTKASESLWTFKAEPGDYYLFGPETRGLPKDVLQKTSLNIRVPMQATARSLNLSNTAAIVGYEAMRQFCTVNQ
jgi:tRNA (cytidine/uridine-2'-O-)-methyltransferase